MHYFLQKKMDGGTFWATFSQTHLVTLTTRLQTHEFIPGPPYSTFFQINTKHSNQKILTGEKVDNLGVRMYVSKKLKCDVTT
jgi:hypothetical protein